MTTPRKRTITALVAAILVLLASAGAAIAVVAASNNDGRTVHGQNYADRDDTYGAHGSRRMTDPGSDAWGSGHSMMGDDGNGYGAMMGPGWAGQGRTDGWLGGAWADSRSYGWNGDGPLTRTQAREEAQRWLDRFAGSARLGDQAAMPMGYWFLAAQQGTVVAMIMVDDDTGAVSGHLRAPTLPR
jgi:hypothetical protein